MDAYAANGTIAAVSVAGATTQAVIANTTRRGRVHYFALSVGGTPVGDNILRWLIRRFTADGTGTVVVPSPLDVGGPASLLSAKANYTVEPTAGVTLFDLAVHQRAIYHWNAVPRQEVVIPATANVGLFITPSHGSYVGTAQSTIHWEE